MVFEVYTDFYKYIQNNNYEVEKKDLLRIFRLAHYLEKLGIIHGDIKLDQYLIRKNEKGEKEIVISDFGFSGCFLEENLFLYTPHELKVNDSKTKCYRVLNGWSFNGNQDLVNLGWKCVDSFTKISKAKYVNILQLEASFIDKSLIKIKDLSDIQSESSHDFWDDSELTSFLKYYDILSDEDFNVYFGGIKFTEGKRFLPFIKNYPEVYNKFITRTFIDNKVGFLELEEILKD
jgi:serine/threonine protein kinase